MEGSMLCHDKEVTPDSEAAKRGDLEIYALPPKWNRIPQDSWHLIMSSDGLLAEIGRNLEHEEHFALSSVARVGIRAVRCP